jgi:hypothetical protein
MVRHESAARASEDPALAGLLRGNRRNLGQKLLAASTTMSLRRADDNTAECNDPNLSIAAVESPVAFLEPGVLEKLELGKDEMHSS